MRPLLLSGDGIAATAADRFEVVANPQPMARLRVKDTDLNVRIALGFDKALLLNLAPATRAHLKAFPLIGKQPFKSNLMPGGSALIRFNLYDVAIAGLPADERADDLVRQGTGRRQRRGHLAARGAGRARRRGATAPRRRAGWSMASAAKARATRR